MIDDQNLVFVYDKEGNKVACPVNLIKDASTLTDEERENCKDAIISQTQVIS